MYHATAHDPAIEGIPPGGGHPSHHRIVRDLPAPLDVVAVVSNPCRYRSRYDLYRAFERHMHCSGVRLTTVECAFGGRPWEVTEAGNPRHLQLRSNYELWHKENLINLGIATLPRDWQYVAWIDADVSFLAPDWAQRTLQALQHYAVVQPWSHAIDLGPDGEPIATHESFLTLYGQFGDLPAGMDGYYYGVGPHALKWHPGFAWAARREAIDALGGLFDVAILGSADRHMAYGLIGRAAASVHPALTAEYRARVMAWQDLAGRYIRRNVGCVPGTIAHAWHGRKADRGYSSRWKILIDHAFDPAIDLKRDWQGVYQLETHDARQVEMRDAIRTYFLGRDEDATRV